MKTKNIIATVVGIFALAIGVFFSNTFLSNANPDYICTFYYEGEACEITSVSCGERQTDHTRSCTESGQRLTKTTYARTRTVCAAGRETTRGGGYTGGASGRKTEDENHYDYTCGTSYTETDSDSPTR